VLFVAGLIVAAPLLYLGLQLAIVNVNAAWVSNHNTFFTSIPSLIFGEKLSIFQA